MTTPSTRPCRFSCGASDPSPGSGLASDTCADVSAPAYTFSLGSHTLSASAEDVAGNVGSGSATFTVVVTFDSLKVLVARFSTNPDVTSGLNDKLTAAAKAKTAARAGSPSQRVREPGPSPDREGAHGGASRDPARARRGPRVATTRAGPRDGPGAYRSRSSAAVSSGVRKRTNVRCAFSGSACADSYLARSLRWFVQANRSTDSSRRNR